MKTKEYIEKLEKIRKKLLENCIYDGQEHIINEIFDDERNIVYIDDFNRMFAE